MAARAGMGYGSGMKKRTRKKSSPAPMLNVGASVESVLAARDALLALLRSGADQPTIVEAIKAFCQVTSVNNVAVSNCVFNGGPS